MKLYPESLTRLIEHLVKLPGIGPKSAQRLAFHFLEASREDVRHLTDSIMEVKEKIKTCSQCFNLSDADPCLICADDGRNLSQLCIVEDIKSLVALERTGQFKGLYHVLQGTLNPLDGISPDELRIRELLQRLQSSAKHVEEIIIATNPSTEGEATALYLAKLLKPLNMKITRTACGLPVGGDMDYADELTLTRALEGRREL